MARWVRREGRLGNLERGSSGGGSLSAKNHASGAVFPERAAWATDIPADPATGPAAFPGAPRPSFPAHPGERRRLKGSAHTFHLSPRQSDCPKPAVPNDRVGGLAAVAISV